MQFVLLLLFGGLLVVNGYPRRKTETGEHRDIDDGEHIEHNNNHLLHESQAKALHKLLSNNGEDDDVHETGHSRDDFIPDDEETGNSRVVTITRDRGNLLDNVVPATAVGVNTVAPVGTVGVNSVAPVTTVGNNVVDGLTTNVVPNTANTVVTNAGQQGVGNTAGGVHRTHGTHHQNNFFNQGHGNVIQLEEHHSIASFRNEDQNQGHNMIQGTTGLQNDRGTTTLTHTANNNLLDGNRGVGCCNDVVGTGCNNGVVGTGCTGTGCNNGVFGTGCNNLVNTAENTLVTGAGCNNGVGTGCNNLVTPLANNVVTGTGCANGLTGTGCNTVVNPLGNNLVTGTGCNNVGVVGGCGNNYGDDVLIAKLVNMLRNSLNRYTDTEDPRTLSQGLTSTIADTLATATANGENPNHITLRDVVNIVNGLRGNLNGNHPGNIVLSTNTLMDGNGNRVDGNYLNGNPINNADLANRLRDSFVNILSNMVRNSGVNGIRPVDDEIDDDCCNNDVNTCCNNNLHNGRGVAVVQPGNIHDGTTVVPNTGTGLGNVVTSNLGNVVANNLGSAVANNLGNAAGGVGVGVNTVNPVVGTNTIGVGNTAGDLRRLQMMRLAGVLDGMLSGISHRNVQAVRKQFVSGAVNKKKTKKNSTKKGKKQIKQDKQAALKVNKPVKVETPVKVEKQVKAEKSIKGEKPTKIKNAVKVDKPAAPRKIKKNERLGKGEAN